MLVLAIDTSTPTVTAGVVSSTGSVALLSEHTFTGPFAHAERLMPLIEEALVESGHRLGELDAIVVGLGPGPFTGLRVGIATAQALGDALEIPVYGIPSHDGMAGGGINLEKGSGRPGPFLVVTDARRREVYLSAYGADGARSAGPVVVLPAAVPELLRERHLAPVSMFGAGTALLATVLPELLVAEPSGTLSSGLVRAASARITTGALPGPLTPLYLRRPDAAEPGARKSVLG